MKDQHRATNAKPQYLPATVNTTLRKVYEKDENAERTDQSSIQTDSTQI